MKKKNLLFVAAAMVMAGCASDDMIGDNAATQSDNQVIGFNMNMPAVTRAELSSEKSATELGGMFIVWGEKNEDANGTAATATNGNLVFQNYVVKYTKDSKNTTVSNTADWKYVGIDHAFIHNTSDATKDYVLSNIGKDVAQTIKYWDDKASSYTFTAVSAPESAITAGTVTIKKTDAGTSVYDKGYEITVNDADAAKKIYVSDRKVITAATQSPYYTHNAVQLKFRNFQSKIRFGIYETVPGYRAVITGIKFNSTEQTGTSGKFGVDGQFIKAGDNTKYKVSYVSTDGDEQNKAKVEFVSGSTASNDGYLDTEGTNWLNTAWISTSDFSKCIGQTSTDATFDKTETVDGTKNAKAYTAILPNPNNTTDLTLQVKFDLYSEDTGEKIEGDYKTVTVPAEYCQWKSNYAYTYLFKITDKSAELYPITFDAVVVTEDYTGEQETITTVDDPSITTYVKGKVQTAYAANDIIYAFGEDGTTTAMSASNMKLYKVTTTDNFEITEASVKHALEQTGVTTKIKAEEITTGNDAPSYEAIPREDSTDGRTITGMKWTAQSNTTYAVEYIKTESNVTTKYYKIIEIK